MLSTASAFVIYLQYNIEFKKRSYETPVQQYTVGDVGVRLIYNNGKATVLVRGASSA